MDKHTHKPIIEVKDLSKRYSISHERGRYATLRDSIVNALRRPFKFIKAKVKQAAGFAPKEEFWALKNVNFHVNKGEVVGIIGRNGAGKSTLLKILSQITPPTTGEIIVRGRVGSLLEVGTGFHPELTGRENIMLNGAILGMTRSEIAKKFDEIVAFAGIEKFLDTPVKFYSSGMYVRLAFSVAAHMEPDILIIDEVLAVGDAEFQKKCLGKMDEVTKSSGRTILFVSHNMQAVKQICKQCILLEKGTVAMVGPTEQVIQKYLDEQMANASVSWSGSVGDQNVRITRAAVASGDAREDFHTDVPIEIAIEGEVLKPVTGLILGFTLYSEFGYELAYVLHDDHETGAAHAPVQPGHLKKRFVIPKDTLAQGGYWIEFDVGIHNTKRIVRDQIKLSFKVHNAAGLGRKYPVPAIQGYSGLFRPNWSKP